MCNQHCVLFVGLALSSATAAVCDSGLRCCSSQPELSMVPGPCLIERDVSWCYIFCAAGFEGRNRPRLLVASSASDYKGRALVGLVCVMMAPR